MGSLYPYFSPLTPSLYNVARLQNPVRFLISATLIAGGGN